MAFLAVDTIGPGGIGFLPPELRYHQSWLVIVYATNSKADKTWNHGSPADVNKYRWTKLKAA